MVTFCKTRRLADPHRALLHACFALMLGMAATFSLPVKADPSASDFALAPSDAVALTWRDAGAGGNRNAERQKTIALGYLSITATEPSEPLQQLALAELYFLSFQPERARELYLPLMASDDVLVRTHAARRMLRMTFAAFNELEAVERDIQTYRETNEASVVDYYGTYPAVRDLATYYRDNGNPAKAVQLIVTELRNRQRASKQASPRLLFDFSDLLAEQLGQGALRSKASTFRDQAIIELFRWQERAESMPTASQTTHDGLDSDWYWSMNGVRAKETLEEARSRNLRFTITKLEELLVGLEQPVADSSQ